MPEGSRSTIVVWALAAVLAVVAGARLLGGNDEAPPAPVRVSAQGEDRAARMYVHVAGAVRRPGLLTMAAGSRVADALERAGGPRPRADLTAVNLAARVQDGQQIVVPLEGRAGAADPAAAIPLGLATATVDQLDEIDGIGPTLAKRIVEQRTKKGGFGSIDELRDVDGIGEKRLAALRAALQP